ncbi:MAG: Nif3-like dinuclear metal center hexameric protein [Candidatus Odinarchaeia archaeon]
MTNLNDIIKFLNKLASPQLADNDDNIGLQVGPSCMSEREKKKIRTIVVSLDPSIETIIFAIDNKAQLLITHHPLFYGKVVNLTGELLKKVRLISSNYLSLFVAHTNWDSAENGNNDTIIELLGLNKLGTFNLDFNNRKSIPIGRICEPPGSLMSIKLLLELISDKLKTDKLRYTGNIASEVKKIILITGSGGKIKFLQKALELGADTFITGEADYHTFKFAEENNLNLIEVGHFETENPGMKRLSQILQFEFPKLKIKFFESASVINYYTK